MAYESLYSNDPIEKTLKYKGQEQSVYFKPLTAGESMQLKSGQKGYMEQGKTKVEIDLGEIQSREHRKLMFSNCTPDGKRVFKDVAEVEQLPDDLFDKLIDLCDEALQPANEGNG